MGWVKNLLKKADEVQKDVIRDVQDGVEHAASEVVDEVKDIIEEADEAQQKILRDFQKRIEAELKKKYDAAIGKLYDRLADYFEKKNPVLQLLAAVMKAYREETLREI